MLSSEDTRVNNIHKYSATANVFLHVLQSGLLFSMRKFLIPTSAHSGRIFPMLLPKESSSGRQERQ